MRLIAIATLSWFAAAFTSALDTNPCTGLTVTAEDCSVVESIACSSLQSVQSMTKSCADTSCTWSIIMETYRCPVGTKRVRANPNASADGTTYSPGGTLEFQSTECVFCLQENSCSSSCTPAAHCDITGADWANITSVSWFKLSAVGSGCSPAAL